MSRARCIEQHVREAGVPDSLNRFVGVTDEELGRLEARLKRSVTVARERHIKNPPKRVPASRSTGLGVPPAFLKRTGARPAITEGDDTMSKKAKTTTNRKARRAASSTKAKAKSASAPAKAKSDRPGEVAKFITGSGKTATAIGAEFELKEHSVRALISGLKKPVKDGGRGLDIKTAKNNDGATVYSIGG